MTLFTALLPDVNPYAFRVLVALNTLRKPIYAGTVPPAEKARRRKAAKAARIARRANRS